MRSGLTAKAVAAVLSLSLLWVAAADAATTRKYKGKTSQGKTITFKIRSGAVRSLKFSIVLNCSDGSTLTDAESGFQATRIRKNKFSDTQVGQTDEVVYNGTRKRKGRRVTGKLTVTDKLNSTVSCGPATVTFSAKRL
jgi:hypothetical protein